MKFMQHDIITSTITWHLGLLGSNNFGEYTSFSPFTSDRIAVPTKTGLTNYLWTGLDGFVIVSILFLCAAPVVWGA